jgi:FtsP/CotA-like multicopper oxidase with cupredoxin domain
MALIVWTLIACSDPPVPASDAGLDSGVELDAGSPDAGFERPVLASPADAIDLDPDPNVVRVELVAAPLTRTVGGRAVDGYAYNGQVPGPTIRLKRGDRLIVDFTNELDTGTTIHWHGVKAPYAMDGVTWMRAPIATRESYRYEFTVDRAGTYWYHPHMDTEHQVDLGLYGVIVVEEPSEPAIDDVVVVLDSIGESEGIDHHSTPLRVEWTANDLVDPIVRGAGPLRLRFVNVSNAGYADLAWPDMRQIASDQGLLSALDTSDHELLVPGDRADFEALGAFDVLVRSHSPAGGEGVATPARIFSVEMPDATGVTWPFVPATVAADPPYADVVYVFQGDGSEWFINGERFPDVTVEELTFGTDAIIEVRNASSSEHPFHVHGHHFEVLSIDGVPPSAPAIEDTFNVAVHSRVRVRMRADNPGDWMTHCHILQHAEHAMMTVLRVLPE